MAIPWMKIDSSFLSNLNPNLKTKLFEKLLDFEKNNTTNIIYPNIEELLDQSNKNFFFMLCPYCNNTALLSTFLSMDDGPFVCIICGETNQYNKIMQSIEKSKILYKIADLTGFAKENIDDTKAKRTLLEQVLSQLLLV